MRTRSSAYPRAIGTIEAALLPRFYSRGERVSMANL